MTELAIAASRSALGFAVLLVISRLEGNKQLSQLNYFNYITGITAGSIGAMLSVGSVPPVAGLAGLASWAVLSLALGWFSLKSLAHRAVVDGEPLVVIRDGKILDRNMAKARYNMNNLLSQLRTQQVFSPSEVAFAILETDGKLSVLKKREFQPATKQDVASAAGDQDTVRQAPPLTPPGRSCGPPPAVPPAAPQLPTELVIDGEVLDENLAAVGKTEGWLRMELGARGLEDLRRVSLAILDHNGRLFVQARESGPGKKQSR